MAALKKNQSLTDKRVLDLAAQLAETTDRNVPLLLLGLQDILDSLVPGSEKADIVKNDIWKYELLQSVLISLQQDFANITGKWNTAAALAKILCHCAVGLDPIESHEFYGIFLPKVTERLLILCRNIQHRYINIPENTLMLKDDLIKNFHDILESLKWLISGHVFLTVNLLRSNYLLQMMITDDLKTSIKLMNLFQASLRVNSGVLTTLGGQVVNSLLDELVYKLSAFNDAEIGAATTRALLTVADVHPPTIQLLYSRYKGLRPLLSRWTGRGFGRDLQRLLLLLDAGSAQEAEMKRLHRAATTIQALWRSFRTRKQLKKANKAIKTFQRSFRMRQEEKDRKREQGRVERELQHQLIVARKKAIRETRQKQLNMIAASHPGDVDKYMEQYQVESAVKIQAAWRGVQTRHKFGIHQATAIQVKAAIAIQRYVRKFLQRQEAKRNEVITWRVPPGLTEERRVEIQEIINQRREERPPAKHKNMDELKQTHKKAQEMLSRHLMMTGLTRKSEQRREALLASLQSDAHLLINAPRIEEATERDLYRYASHSVPIASKAQDNHKERVKLLKAPWWKKLDDEDAVDSEAYQEDQNDYVFS